MICTLIYYSLFNSIILSYFPISLQYNTRAFWAKYSAKVLKVYLDLNSILAYSEFQIKTLARVQYFLPITYIFLFLYVSANHVIL